MDSESTHCNRIEELWAVEGEVCGRGQSPMLGAAFLQVDIEGGSRGNDQFADLRALPEQLSMDQWSDRRRFLLSHEFSSIKGFLLNSVTLANNRQWSGLFFYWSDHTVSILYLLFFNDCICVIYLLIYLRLLIYFYNKAAAKGVTDCELYTNNIIRCNIHS